ncbi:hypothetical protein V2J09_012999 [Rumex salicifolius]
MAARRRDEYNVFAEPVDPAQVEDYNEIIKDPMDFGTMRAKLQEDMYRSLPQFQHDVFLIFRNAMHFNPSTTVYFKQARTLHDMASKVFDALKTDPHKFEVEFDTTKRRSASGDRDSYTGSLPKPPNRDRKGLFTRDGSYSTLMLNVGITENLDFTMMYADSTPLVHHMSEQDITYRESLVEFVKDLGPTAKRVAQRKLQEAESSSRFSDVIMTNPCANKNKTTHKAATSPLGTKRKTHMARRIMNKKIVLAVPAACHARSYRSCKSATNSIGHLKRKDAVQRLPKQRKIEVNVKDLHRKHKGAMIAPSWQLNSSSDVNTLLIGFSNDRA